MAIAPKCDKCGKELITFGAILFGSPNEQSEVIKYHLCQGCYVQVVSSFKPKTATA